MRPNKRPAEESWGERAIKKKKTSTQSCETVGGTHKDKLNGCGQGWPMMVPAGGGLPGCCAKKYQVAHRWVESITSFPNGTKRTGRITAASQKGPGRKGIGKEV